MGRPELNDYIATHITDKGYMSSEIDDHDVDKTFYHKMIGVVFGPLTVCVKLDTFGAIIIDIRNGEVGPHVRREANIRQAEEVIQFLRCTGVDLFLYINRDTDPTSNMVFDQLTKNLPTCDWSSK